jgi:hypothetical protein
MIQWESSNDPDVYRLLDSYPFVDIHCEQPLIVSYQIVRKMLVHYPESLIVTWLRPGFVKADVGPITGFKIVEIYGRQRRQHS